MPINIQTNIGPTMRSLSEQGTFRNSMYQQQEQKKKEKQKVTVRPTLVKDDVAAHFVKNEEFRLQSAGLQNEISHLEEEISIVQTAAGALERVEDLLIQMKELLVIVTNETEYNAAIRKADQDELVHLINRINKVADETSYGHQSLLDGSHGVRGVASGEHLEFVGMNTDSKTSPLNGYEVVVTEAATRSELQGLHPFTQDMVDNEEQLFFERVGCHTVLPLREVKVFQIHLIVLSAGFLIVIYRWKLLEMQMRYCILNTFSTEVRMVLGPRASLRVFFR